MMGRYSIFVFFILPAITTAAVATIAIFKKSWAVRKNSKSGYTPIPSGDDVAVVPYKPGPTAKVAEVVGDVGRVLALGAVFVAASGVNRWRRWRRGSELGS
jgi:uncharacterized membrane protein YidH (DUF202 family)